MSFLLASFKVPLSRERIAEPNSRWALSQTSRDCWGAFALAASWRLFRTCDSTVFASSAALFAALYRANHAETFTLEIAGNYYECDLELADVPH